MNETNTLVDLSQLNAGQKAAVEGFFEFLMDPDQTELHISGPGGVGKTFTMSYFIDSVIPQYHATCELLGIKPKYHTAMMCATTNKAAAVLQEATKRPTSTVHNLFNLTVSNNFRTGEVDLIPKKSFRILKNMVIFIDEGSMIDWKLLKYIREGTMDCKIVFISDHCQLPPVKENLSPIYSGDLKMFELLEPVRNAEQPALMALCQQVRETVLTGEFKPIKIIPGVVDLFDAEQMEAQIQTDFVHQNKNARILCYSNNQVLAYNDYVRTFRQLGSDLTVGEILVNNSAVELNDGEILSVEEEVTITNICGHSTVTLNNEVEMAVQVVDLMNSYGETYGNILVPSDKDHYRRLISYYQKEKNWSVYFYLKNQFADLRPRDACTIHKSQGSTYDTVYIDMADVSSCHNPKLAARLLYVAVSRARSRIIMYGQLHAKYGGYVE